MFYASKVDYLININEINDRVSASILKFTRFLVIFSWQEFFFNKMLPSIFSLGLHWYHLMGAWTFLADAIFEVAM